MVIELVRWWYTTGWMQAIHRISSWTLRVEHAFSVGILVRTLFAPWRRIVSLPGRSIDARIHAALDNFVSRCIGAVVRFVTLLAAAFLMLLAFVSSTLLVLIWPLLPIGALYFAVRSIIG